MNVAWDCEMAILWGYDYWDLHTIRVMAPYDIPYWKLDGIARDMIWEDDAFDDATGTYLFNNWRVEA